MEEDRRTRLAALEAQEWHHASTGVMKEIRGIDPGDEIWLPKWLVVRGVILAHLEVEESQALDLLQRYFERDELERLGSEFSAVEESMLREGAGKG
jgi:hypothetical protein